MVSGSGASRGSWNCDPGRRTGRPGGVGRPIAPRGGDPAPRVGPRRISPCHTGSGGPQPERDHREAKARGASGARAQSRRCPPDSQVAGARLNANAAVETARRLALESRGPKLSNVSLRARTICERPRRACVTRARLEFHLGRAATTRLELMGWDCEPGRCAWRPAGAAVRAARPGANVDTITAGWQGRVLRPGRYRLRLLASTGVSRSSIVARDFRVGES